MIKRAAAVVSVVLLPILWSAPVVGPAAADTAVARTLADPTVVRLLGGGVLQVVTPEDDSAISVGPTSSSGLSVTDFRHSMEAVAPC